MNKSVKHHEVGYQQNAWPFIIENIKTMKRLIFRRCGLDIENWMVTQERMVHVLEMSMGLYVCVCVCELFLLVCSVFLYMRGFTQIQ